jgi:hypothetical protein
MGLVTMLTMPMMTMLPKLSMLIQSNLPKVMVLLLLLV